MSLLGRRLPVGAGAAKLPFTEMRGLPDGRFRRTSGTAALGHFETFAWAASMAAPRPKLVARADLAVASAQCLPRFVGAQALQRSSYDRRMA